AGMVVAGQVEVEGLPLGLLTGGRGVAPCGLDGGVQTLEATEGLGERVGPGVRDVDRDDAGELAGELGQLAAGPAAVVLGDDVGECADETGPVVADDGDDESGHASTIAAT